LSDRIIWLVLKKETYDTNTIDFAFLNINTFNVHDALYYTDAKIDNAVIVITTS